MSRRYLLEWSLYFIGTMTVIPAVAYTFYLEVPYFGLVAGVGWAMMVVHLIRDLRRHMDESEEGISAGTRPGEEYRFR